MRFVPVLLIALAGGCSAAGAGAGGSAGAGAGTPQASAPAPSTRGSVIMAREREFVSADVGPSPAEVWPLVAQAYSDIGFPMDHVDNAARVATATNQRVRRLAGKGMSTYFNCAGPFGNTANRDDVFVTVRTEVVPGRGEGSIIRVGAAAISRSTTAANTVTDCGSTGELERLVIDTILARANAK